MVSKRAAHSRTEDDLPAGWSKRLQVLNTGRKVKYYEDSRTGQKLFSKDHILQYVEIHDALQPTERRDRKRSNPSKLRSSGTEEATNEEWLPRGWLVRIRYRKRGSRCGESYKTYVEQSTGRMFYSRVKVLRYLKSVEGKSCISPASSAKAKVVTETSSEDLPPGWIKEFQIRKNAGGIMKDHGTEEAVNELLEWLPRGWLVRIRYRKRGPRRGETYKIYVEQSTGRMFYSRAKMLRYLKSAKGKSCISPAASAKEKVVIETSSEDLPPGWIKELEIRKNAGGIRKDPYYRDPKSGCLFRSRREVEHYLETGEISRRVLLETERRIIGKHSSTSSKCKNLIDHSDGTHLSAEKRGSVRGMATRSAASISRKDGRKMIMPETEQPSVSTSETSHEHCPETNTSSSSSESQERISESAGDGATSKDVGGEQIVGSENAKEYNGNSPGIWRDSDKIIEVISHRRFSSRLARFKSEQESKSISKALAAPDATSSHEDKDVAVTSTSKCMTTEASRSSLPTVNTNNEEELISPRRFSRRVAGLEPQLVPDSVSKGLFTQEESAGDGATESANDKEYNGNSPGSWRDSDKIKDVVISHRCFSRRLGRFKSEQESKSISKAVVVTDTTNSHEDGDVEDRDVTATATAKCITIEASQFLEATVNLEKQEGGSGNACVQLLQKGSITVQVNLQDEPAPIVATPFETGCGSSLVSTPLADVLNPETTTEHDEDEMVIHESKSMHIKRLDFSQESSKCPSVPMPEIELYPSGSEISKTKHIEKVGSQDASVVNRNNDVIQDKCFPLSARSVRYLKRTDGLRQETVGKPPQCESTDGDNAMSLPVKDISGKQLQDVETNKTRNDDSDSYNSIPEKEHPDVETNTMRSNANNSSFGSSSADIWSDPCIEFAFKTLTGALPIEDFLNTPLVSISAVCDRNEKNLQLDTSQKITEKESEVPSTVHKRETAMALESKKRGKPGNAESFPHSASSLTSLQNDSSKKYKVGGFMEYANNEFGFARRAKQYASSSKSQEPRCDSTIMPSQLESLAVRSMQNEEAAPASFLSFGDCWSDPLLEYALETPTGLIPLKRKGDLSKIARLQHRIGSSCSLQRNASFQLHETNLDQKDSKADVSHSCFETDKSYCSLAPDQSQPISKPRTAIHQQPQLASATPIVLACPSSMNPAESHLNDRPKRGRPRKKP